MSKNNGYAQFVIRKRENKKALTGNMCPVSPNIPTRMTMEGFARACKGIRAGGKYKLECEHWLCPECALKQKIDKGRKFSPPNANIQFISLSDFKTPVDDMAALLHSRKIKNEYPLLTREIAEFIKDWHKKAPGINIATKARMLGIGRKIVSRVINGDTWK